MAPPFKRNPTLEALVAKAFEAKELRRKAKKEGIPKTCPCCKKDFKARQVHQRFCSTPCRKATHALEALEAQENLLKKIEFLDELVELRDKEILNLKAEIARLEKQ